MSCVARLCFVCLLLTFLRFVLPYAALALGNPTPPALCQQPTLAVPAGPNGVVLAMVRARGNLYIGGSFTAVGGVAARNVARWDGHAWSSCGPGGLQPFATIYALAATADGQLYAAGQLADSACCAGMAGAGGDSGALNRTPSATCTVQALAVLPTGEVYVGEQFAESLQLPGTHFLGRWKGRRWAYLRETGEPVKPPER